MTIRRALLLLLLLLAPGNALALPGSTRITVEAIAGAAPPHDTALARKVASELERLGYETGPNAPLHLTGKMTAVSRKDGAHFRIDWTLRDATGQELGTFTNEAIAPYRATNPWDALDADTLTKLARASAGEVERKLEDTPIGGAPVTASAAPAPPKPEKPLVQTGAATKVFIVGVKGAPGDGDIALPNALAFYFAQFDIELLSAKAPDAYVIEGEVAVKPKSANEDAVKIIWRLKNAKGKELAQIAQNNIVPTGSLASHWGKTAQLAAEGAADGLLATMASLGTKPPTP